MALAARKIQQGNIAKIGRCVCDVLQRARDCGVICVRQRVHDGGMTRELSRVLIGCDFDTE